MSAELRPDWFVMLEFLRERGQHGAHTSEIRRLGISGNPSQRRLDLIDRGCRISSTPEDFTDARGKRRRGARFILISEPDDVGLDGGPAGSVIPAPAAHGPSPEPEQLPAVEPSGDQLLDTVDLDIPPVGDYRDAA